MFADRGQKRTTETDQLVETIAWRKKEGEFAGLIDGRLLVQKEASRGLQTKAPVVIHIASHAFFLADRGKRAVRVQK